MISPLSGTNASIARCLATLFGLAATASAEIVNFNFETFPVPSGEVASVSLPYNEQGLRLIAAVNGVGVATYGPSSPRYPGSKAMVPAAFATGEDVVYQIFSPSGRLFAVRSVTLHPPITGAARNVTFTRFFNGSGVSQTHTTGTAISGNTSTFNSNFDRVGNLEFRHVRVSGVYQSFQISSIVVEFDGVLSTPSQIVANEAAGTVSVPVTLDHPRTTDTPLTWLVNPVTATQGTDYTLPGGNNTGTFIIPAGQTMATLQIPITNDTTVEGAETFRVNFTSNIDSVLFAGNATSGFCDVMIASDDGVTTFPNWMTAHGLTSTAASPGADPNGDGINNIESWLFRLNPAGPNPPSWLARRATFSGGASDPKLTLFIPAPLPNDVLITLSETTTLDSWTEQTRRTGFGIGSLWTGPGASRVVESNSFSGRTLSLRASVPAGPRPSLFLRNTYEYVPGGIAD
jgi:hypothetical protein